MVRRAPRNPCAECGEADFCDRPKRCGDAVVNCKNLQEGKRRLTGKGTGSGKPSAESRRIGKEVSLGLCRTCSHQRVCAYLKKKGGVWHCEEFSQSE